MDGDPSALKLPSWRIWTDDFDLIFIFCGVAEENGGDAMFHRHGGEGQIGLDGLEVVLHGHGRRSFSLFWFSSLGEKCGT